MYQVLSSDFALLKNNFCTLCSCCELSQLLNVKIPDKLFQETFCEF